MLVKDQNGQAQNIEIETGIEIDAYVEVKSGLSKGDIVLIEETEEDTRDVMQKQIYGEQGGGRGGSSSQRTEKPMSQ